MSTGGTTLTVNLMVLHWREGGGKGEVNTMGEGGVGN